MSLLTDVQNYFSKLPQIPTLFSTTVRTILKEDLSTTDLPAKLKTTINCLRNGPGHYVRESVFIQERPYDLPINPRDRIYGTTVYVTYNPHDFWELEQERVDGTTVYTEFYMSRSGKDPDNKYWFCDQYTDNGLHNHDYNLSTGKIESSCYVEFILADQSSPAKMTLTQRDINYNESGNIDKVWQSKRSYVKV